MYSLNECIIYFNRPTWNTSFELGALLATHVAAAVTNRRILRRAPVSLVSESASGRGVQSRVELGPTGGAAGSQVVGVIAVCTSAV